MEDRKRATLAGLGAIGLWALLAPLGVAAGPVPPFLLTGLAFAVGGSLGLALRLARGDAAAGLFRVPAAAWLLGVGAFFGYHALYFTALQALPPVEALLIINLWPLLIVLLTGLLPGERLLPQHVVGVLCGLVGAAVLVLGRGEATSGTPAPSAVGYVAAAGCALIWSGYSVLNRRLVPDVPSDAVTGFCLVTAALALLAHALLEPAGWPQGGGAWLAVLALGVGPVGAAFFLWDLGTKRGALQLLGAAAYLAPLLGALLLLLMGRGQPSLGLLVAAVLIVGGAVIAGRAKPKRASPSAAPAA